MKQPAHQGQFHFPIPQGGTNIGRMAGRTPGREEVIILLPDHPIIFK